MERDRHDTVRQFDWGKKATATKISDELSEDKDDEMKKSVSKIREALKKRPTFDGYMKLLDILLNYILHNRKWTNELLDELLEVTKDYKEWHRT